MHQTFISFSSKDKETALTVHDALSARGINCWISARDISGSTNYQLEIPRALKKATVMALILSENASSSNNITDEIALAKRYHLHLMPLKIDENVSEEAFELSLATSQYIALYPDFNKQIEESAVTIKGIYERHDKFADLLSQYSDDDICKTHIEKWLLEKAEELGLTIGQAKKIINHALGGATKKESEPEYLKLVEDVLEDGIVSSIEVQMLSDRATKLGISPKRADELLLQETKKRGIFDAPITDIVKNNSKPIIEDSKYSQQNSDDDSILTANAQILFDPDLDTTLTDNNTANNTLTEESAKDSEEDFEDIPAENTTIDKTRSPQTKNQLTISGKMHVSTLKKQFKSLFGLTLRIYDGRSFADEKATIANIRKVDNKGGEYSPRNNTKLVTIENKMMEVFGLKVQIYGSDDSYSCNRELTLKQAKIEDDKKIEQKELKILKQQTQRIKI